MVAIENFEQEFAERTLSNLEYIRKCARKQHEGYEITQLINSLLGMLIFLHEKKASLINKNITDYDINININWLDDYDKWDENWREDNENHMSNIIRHMRNSLAHCGVSPKNEGGIIKGFTFLDRKPIEFHIETIKVKYSIPYWKIYLDNDVIYNIAIDMFNAMIIKK